MSGRDGKGGSKRKAKRKQRQREKRKLGRSAKPVDSNCDSCESILTMGE